MVGIADVSQLGRCRKTEPPPRPTSADCLLLMLEETLIDEPIALRQAPSSRREALLPARVDRAVVPLLTRAARNMSDAIAILSAASIDEVDRLLYPLQLSAVGAQGREWRLARSAALELRPAADNVVRLAGEVHSPGYAAGVGALLAQPPFESRRPILVTSASHSDSALIATLERASGLVLHVGDALRTPRAVRAWLAACAGTDAPVHVHRTRTRSAPRPSY